MEGCKIDRSVHDLERSIKIQKWLGIVLTWMFLISFTTAVGVVTYWKLEPDPLTVTDTGSCYSVCTERQFSFSRHVKSTKDLKIYIQNRWHDTDGFMDSNDIPGELALSSPDFYPLGAGFENITTFDKQVPHTIPVGNYTYIPSATYEVNPLKTITRPLPAQSIQVVCVFNGMLNQNDNYSNIRLFTHYGG
jgi:hypothetical protein